MRLANFKRRILVAIAIVAILVPTELQYALAINEAPEQATIIRVRLFNRYGGGTTEIDPTAQPHVQGSDTLYNDKTKTHMITDEQYDVVSQDGDKFRLAVSISTVDPESHKPLLYRSTVDISLTTRAKAIAFRDVIFDASVVRRPSHLTIEEMKAILRQDHADERADEQELKTQ